MTLGQLTENIKHELKSFYNLREIWSFIYMIFEHLEGLDRTAVLAKKDMEISDTTVEKVKEITRELKAYKPIQYILGETQFLDLTLEVNPSVLIPRPETEQLVSFIIEENIGRSGLKIIDIGTGSGAIAIALAKKLDARVYATDISTKAIETAKGNAIKNNAQVKFKLHDILAGYPPVFEDGRHKYDIIVSNPPYVLPSDKNKMSRTVLDYEPEEALFVPEENPLIFYDAICRFADDNLADEGIIYFEINEYMHREMLEMLRSRGYKDVSILQDFNDKFRVVKVKK